MNVIGTGYKELGYWSNGLGFSKNIHENSSYNSSLMIDLGQVYWPSAKRLRIGVPSNSGYKEYVKVEGTNNFSGFSIEVFKATTESMPFFPPYDFQYFNRSYNELVEQIHRKVRGSLIE